MMAAVAMEMSIYNPLYSVLLKEINKAAAFHPVIGRGKVHHDHKVIITFIYSAVQCQLKSAQLTVIELFILRGIAAVIRTGPALGSTNCHITVWIKTAFNKGNALIHFIKALGRVPPVVMITGEIIFLPGRLIINSISGCNSL